MVAVGARGMAGNDSIRSVAVGHGTAAPRGAGKRLAFLFFPGNEQYQKRESVNTIRAGEERRFATQWDSFYFTAM